MNNTLVKEKILVPRSFDLEAVKSIAKQANLPEIASSVLFARNITDPMAIKSFLNPSLEGLHDPFLFKDMEKAVERIILAIQNNEKICVHGDYDVDGITSIALLLRFFKSHSVNADFYIPNRLSEGYGLSEQGIRHIHNSGATLIITVDCGITAPAEVAIAADLDMDVIITDHHLPQEKLPQAYAIINPKVPGSGYPDAGLAGVGVAFKLIQALHERLFSGKDNTEVFSYLDLVSIGTTADIVPLTGENRIFVREGFNRLKGSFCEGVKALLRISGLYDKTISTGQVIFQIAPLINAVGRLSDPGKCVEFFLTEDANRASELALELKKNNIDRRTIDQAITDECFARIDADIDLDKTYFIVLSSETWHPGVVGIVASRIVERYARPALLICVEGEFGRGSARSIPGLHVVDAITLCADLLEEYGGHEFAAGVTLKKENIPLFAERLNSIALKKLTPSDLVRSIRTDTEINRLDDIHWDVLHCLKSFEPHGPENPKPVFYAKDLRIIGEPRIVGTNHLKLKVRGGRTVFDAIAFKMGDKLQHVTEPGRLVTLAFTLEENEWMGEKSIQLNVRGIE